VSVIERVGLGAPVPGDEQRVLWMVPGDLRVEVFVRELAAGKLRSTGISAPATGSWAPPPYCPHTEGQLVAAAFPCPHCHVQPAQFIELADESAFMCPACGESFVPRISRF
jgi:predicted RNA-binding Zn-ribbon protein involved in translation (DUF1610 family)